jgi:hypothetical protein
MFTNGSTGIAGHGSGGSTASRGASPAAFTNGSAERTSPARTGGSINVALRFDLNGSASEGFVVIDSAPRGAAGGAAAAGGGGI